MSKARRIIMDAATVCAALSAAIITAIAIIERHDGRRGADDRVDRIVDNWRNYGQVGHRVGPDDAEVVIVEWVDYQCPACRAFEPILRAARVRYSDDVAVIYRHWPLPTHPMAYSAAVAAECAAKQGRFEQYHDLLYDTSDWIRGGAPAFQSLASRARVAQIGEFERCSAQTMPVPDIERDIEAVKEMGGRGTPTLLFDSIHLRAPPDSSTLDRMIRDALRR